MRARPRVAIVDFGMGNLFSVRQACEHADLEGVTTADPKDVLASHAVILPGVGAFADAMAALRMHGLDDAIQETVARGTPFIGICLGMQLLATESEEFGRHEGLDIIPGRVAPFSGPSDVRGPLKVPHVGWNSIHESAQGVGAGAWTGTPLSGVAEGEFMYFVHSYRFELGDPSLELSATRYGDAEFTSSFLRRNVFACQFHPEKSGPAGLAVYDNIRTAIERDAGELRVKAYE